MMKKAFVFIFTTLLMIQSSTSQVVTVSHFSGSGRFGFLDDSAKVAKFAGPSGMVFDELGNLYVSEITNHTIRKVDSSGYVTTIAGSIAGQGSVDGQDTSARFNHPRAIAIDGKGNLITTGLFSKKIRKITPEGYVSTLAGSGSYGSENGQGSAASFQMPIGIAIDEFDNIYIADASADKIRLISPSGLVSDFAGTGINGFVNGPKDSAKFSGPSGLAFDNKGNLYVSEVGNHAIRKITPDGLISTVAGSGFPGENNGSGVGASFNTPYGLDVDDQGNIYVADSKNNRIRMISHDGTVTTVAGSVLGYSNGEASLAKFYHPEGVVIAKDGSVYVSDLSKHNIRKISIETLTNSLKVDTKNSFLVSPNPNAGNFQVSFENDFKGRVSVFNSLGQMIEERDVQGLEKFHMDKGIYFVKFRNNCKKVVVQ
jgi:sugar lactone lactonase YvrE